MKVYNYQGEWIVLDGNMRLKAMQEVGIQEAQCLVVPQDAPAAVLRKIVIEANSTFGRWDMDALANEWDAKEVSDWGVVVPEINNIDVDALFEDAEEQKPKAQTIVIELPEGVEKEQLVDIVKAALVDYAIKIK